MPEAIKSNLGHLVKKKEHNLFLFITNKTFVLILKKLEASSYARTERSPNERILVNNGVYIANNTNCNIVNSNVSGSKCNL